MNRKYSMTKRLEKAYKNYEKRYEAKQASLSRRGYQMADKKLTRKEYDMVRKAYVESGVEQNINQTIVSDQAYEYSQKTARQMKSTAKKFNLEWKDKTITELRKGEIDVSGINNSLKEMSDQEREALFDTLPADVKRTNQGYISWVIYASK